MRIEQILLIAGAVLVSIAVIVWAVLLTRDGRDE
jgi:uncharacterized membrane protein YcjF (UPF0283 family)